MRREREREKEAGKTIRTRYRSCTYITRLCTPRKKSIVVMRKRVRKMFSLSAIHTLKNEYIRNVT